MEALTVPDRLTEWERELETHLTRELLPFWLDRCCDSTNGGFITHFDCDGNDTGENEKSLIAQARTVYSMSRAHLAGYGDGACAELADHGVRYLIERMWDEEHGGFHWMTDRRGRVGCDRKIVYGQSFAIYALSTCHRATGNQVALEYARRTFDLLGSRAADTSLGGYFEMFESDWTLSGPGAAGGDRKTLDVHMHVMEAFTALFRSTREEPHRRRLCEIIELLQTHLLHPVYRTGIPQFYPDWRVAPQIKFDVIWGWDRFSEDGVKSHAEDNTSPGHNAEFAWLLLVAADALDAADQYLDEARVIFDHVVAHGIDAECGGVYVEGPHSGGVYDREKEFWQQAEVMIGMLEAYRRFQDVRYLEAYERVHRFVFDHGINHPVGEWWPLLTRDGRPIWTHMGHSWKVSYHTIRSVVECLERIRAIMKG